MLGVIFFTFYILKTTKKKEYPSILLANFFILFIGIIIFLYGLIQLVQPDDYIKFTKTTISTKTETPIEKK